MAGRPLIRETEGALIARLEQRIAALERRRAVSGHYAIKLFGDDEEVEAVEGRFLFAIPFDLHRAKLRYVGGYVTTIGADDLTVQIHNVGSTPDPAGFDMLSSPIQIDAGELDAEGSSAPWAIETQINNEYPYPDSDNTVFYRQQLRIDIITDGSGAMGLGVHLGFD